MSRRRKAIKRVVEPDVRYQSVLVGSLINLLMKDGKKALARRIVYNSFERISEKLGKGDPIDILIGALDNTRPKLEVKSRRMGGATYQVPVEVSFERQQSLAFRWLINSANSRKGINMSEAFALELVDAYNNTGPVVKRKEEMHRMAQANRAFAHLR
jgi:small subunit ribosomal protein S7